MAFTVTLPSGVEWTPKFVQSIDQGKCIGCGRCFKVCSRGVMQLRGVDEDGELIALAVGDDDADDEAEYEKKVMTLVDAAACIGCQACSMVCPKKCYAHAEAA
jgi:Nif-specific ferredoxin III